MSENYENNSTKFYKEHSACDMGDIRERQQKWLEAKFQEANEDEPHLFIEQNFDSFFRDFSLNPDTKSIDSSAPKQLKEAADCKFSREDLQQSSDTKSAENYSVYTDKGSEGGVFKETSQPKAGEKKYSNFWKRVDMRQKKVIRGLCGLARDYFRDVIANKKASQEVFALWDECLKTKFPELYHTSRLQLLGHISAMCLSWKFPDKIKACSLFNEEEKHLIIKEGTKFREQRNNCSSSIVRKEMLSSLIVRIGKLLYCSSIKYEESFWNQILERKKADIIDFKLFKATHLKDINKVKAVSCSEIL